MWSVGATVVSGIWAGGTVVGATVVSGTDVTVGSSTGFVVVAASVVVKGVALGVVNAHELRMTALAATNTPNRVICQF